MKSIKELIKELNMIKYDKRNLNFYVPKELLPYELHGYVQGDEVVHGQGVDLFFFDNVRLIGNSPNQKTNKKFIHAVGDYGKFTYLLILKFKPNE